VLDLIEGKMGILDLLDEQCRFPTATHKVGLIAGTVGAQPCVCSSSSGCAVWHRAVCLQQGCL
jgi:hypothetical protein